MPKRSYDDQLASGSDTEQAPRSKRPAKFCTCWKYCKGGKQCSYATWKNHKAFRNLAPGAEVPQHPAQRRRQRDAATTPGTSRQASVHIESLSEDEAPGRTSRTPTPMPGGSDARSTTRAPSPSSHSPDSESLVPRDCSPHRSCDARVEPHAETDADDDHDVEPDVGSDEQLRRAGPSPEEAQEEDEDDLELLAARSKVADLAVLQDFNERLRRASLDACGLSPSQLERLRNPPQGPLVLDPHADRILILCLRTYMTCRSGSHSQYSQQITNMRLAYPDDADEYLSEAQIQARLEDLTGVVSQMADMCIDSCVGFTGPWSELRACPLCSKPRYLATGKPAKQFSTILLPQQVQALRRHPESAKNAQYIWQRLEEIENLIKEHGFLPEYDDIICGSELREAYLRGDISENDTVLLVTVDGAQLYRNKASDCWMYGWILVNLHPGLRYKQRYLLPGGFIGGPSKPKIFESFLHIGLRIVSAVNNDGGLRVWDAHLLRSYLTKLFIAYGLADGPGSTVWSSLVPHHGKIPCRIACGMLGRHKPNSPIYYPAALKPANYTVAGCDHGDIDPTLYRAPNVSAYVRNLRFVLESRNQTQYEQRRRDTGVAKPSPFAGLDPRSVIGPPSMFPLDVMHVSLNWGDLLLSLWRGTIDCDETDSRISWDFAVLKGTVWTLHGEDVARCTRFLPSLFGRPPRNPAEKINSGYKAWEFVLYLWALGPGLFFGVLPEKYWKNFCMLVFVIRHCKRKEIPVDYIVRAYQVALEFEVDFEEKYYRRRTDRLHFIRPTVHNVTHLPSEILRVGPLPCVSQWTMERFIGLLTADLKQHSTPYANIAARGLERAQLNALAIMVPELDTSAEAMRRGRLPRGSKDLGGGYVLLRAKESRATSMTGPETAALEDFVARQGIAIPTNWEFKIQRWARLQLPNGQVVRAAWKERLKAPEALRRARDARISYIEDQTDYAEVIYYFRYDLDFTATEPDMRTLVMVSLCTRPDEELLKASYGTLWSCKHQGEAGLYVVDYTAMQALVAIVPHSQMLPEEFSDRFFVAEMPGLDVADLGGSLRDATEHIERLYEDRAQLGAEPSS